MSQSRAQAMGTSVKAGQILTWRATAGRSRFVLLNGLGEATVVEGLPKEDILAVL